MQIKRDFRTSAPVVTFMDGRHDFISRVFVSINVIDSDPVRFAKIAGRTPAMTEVDQLLRQVGEFLEQRSA